MRPNHPATCHPKLKNYAKGLCASCYYHARKALSPKVKAAEKAVRDQKAEAAKYVTVHLQMRHSINGTFVGPGPVRVPVGQAEAFLNVEHEAIQKEQSLTQQQSFIIGWGPFGPVKRQVPTARFEELLTREGGY